MAQTLLLNVCDAPQAQGLSDLRACPRLSLRDIADLKLRGPRQPGLLRLTADF